MGVNRIQQPWGFQDETRFQGGSGKFEDLLDSFFADAKYDGATNLMQFYNRDGAETVSVDLSDLRTKDLVESTRYEDGYIIMVFSNGDEVSIDVRKLLDETEFSDGLKVDGGIVSVKIDDDSEGYLAVGKDGIKLSGVDDAIKSEVGRAESDFRKKIDELLESIDNAKADKEHEHTTDYISDIGVDGSGVVLDKDVMDGTVTLNAGKF